MKATLRCLAVLAALVASPQPSELFAQADNEWLGLGAANDWTDSSNWSAGGAPDPDFDDNAKIGTETGVEEVPDIIAVTLSTDLSGTPSPQIILGDGGGFEGTLNLLTGTVLTTQTGAQATSANVDVGINGGTGFLNISGTAQLTVGGTLATPSSGNTASAITLIDSASVSAASAFLDRNLKIVGPNVSVAIAGDAILGQGGTHAWEFALTGGTSGPSALSVAGELDLGGALKINTLGETPSVGDSFVIADSASVINGFGNVDISDVPGLGLGVSVRAQSVADGSSTNGVLTSVVVEQQPVLVVNRRTGDVSIRNPGAAASLEFDAYVIGSQQGSLNPANWTSLAPADGWQEANPSSNALSELNPLSSQAIAASTTEDMGDVFQPADLPFGEDTDDVTFRYAPSEQGFVDGMVVYEGIPTDTLTLNIDRTNGDAQILNGFRSGVSIDTYLITSESDSLDPSPGGWTSLGGDWQIALNEAGRLSELNPLSDTSLASGEGVALGSLFDFDAAGVQEDLVFQFALPNEEFFRTGKVVFGDELTTLPQGGLEGDFNDDGVVDAADYAVWRDNLGLSDSALNGNGTGGGTVVQADYTLWRSQYGATSESPLASSGVGAPEPGTLALAGLALMASLGRLGRPSREV